MLVFHCSPKWTQLIKIPLMAAGAGEPLPTPSSRNCKICSFAYWKTSPPAAALCTLQAIRWEETCQSQLKMKANYCNLAGETCSLCERRPNQLWLVDWNAVVAAGSQIIQLANDKQHKCPTAATFQWGTNYSIITVLRLWPSQDSVLVMSLHLPHWETWHTVAPHSQNTSTFSLSSASVSCPTASWCLIH